MMNKLTKQTSIRFKPADEPATLRKGSNGSEILYNNMDLQAVRVF